MDMMTAIDGGELRVYKQEHDGKAWKDIIFHSGGQGGTDVIEDLRRTELPETDGTVEWEHSLPDVLRRDNQPYVAT